MYFKKSKSQQRKVHFFMEKFLNIEYSNEEIPLAQPILNNFRSKE